jgi:hypothetical protein
MKGPAAMKQKRFQPALARPAARPGPLGPSEAARRDLALKGPETLILVELLIEDPGPEGPALMRRLAGRLRLCADIPEFASAAGCAPERIDRGLMRAAARLLSQAAHACGP